MYLGLGCGFVQSAVTKSYKQGGLLTTEIYFSQFWRLEVQVQGATVGQIPVQTLFPVVDCHFILVSSNGKSALWVPFIRALIPFMRAPPHDLIIPL